MKKSVMLVLAAVLLMGVLFAGVASAVAANGQDAGVVLTGAAGATDDADEIGDDESNKNIEVSNWDELVANVSTWQRMDKTRTIILANVTEGAYKNMTGQLGEYSGIPVKGYISIMPKEGCEIKIDANQKGRLFNVTGGNLTLGVKTGTLTLTNGTAPEDYLYGEQKYSCGGAVQVLSGNLTLGKGVTISNSNATCGGGVYVENGRFIMKNGTITGCTGTYDGGVYVWNGGKFTMSGGEISDCKGTTYSGVIIDGGVFNVSGSARIPGTGTAGVYLNGTYTLNLVGKLTGNVTIAYPVAKKGNKFGTATSKKAAGAENITSADENYYCGFINTSGKPYTLEWKKVPLNDVYVVDTPEKIYEVGTLEEALEDVAVGGTIHLVKPSIELKKPLKISKAVTIKTNTGAVIKSMVENVLGEANGENPLLTIMANNTKGGKNNGPITLENVTIDFNNRPGNIQINDHTPSKYADNRKTVSLNNVTLKQIATDLSTQSQIFSVIHIVGADVKITDLNITLPDDPSLLDLFVATFDLESRDTWYPSNLTIDALPYAAYCKAQSDKQPKVYQNISGTPRLVDPITIELLFDNLYVWPGFDKVHPASSWADLASAADIAKPGEIIQLTGYIESTGDPESITIPAGVAINPYNDDVHNSINLTDSTHSIVVNDYLGLVTALGSDKAVIYGNGYLNTSEDFQNIELLKDNLYIPPKTTIQVSQLFEGSKKNNITITLPKDETFVFLADKDGFVQIKENKNVTVTGDGKAKIVNDPRDPTNITNLTVNGTLTFKVPITWDNVGITGVGELNIDNPNSGMPAGDIPKDMKDKIEVAPITASTSGGAITDKAGNPVDTSKLLVKYNSTWTITDNYLNLTITNTTGTSESYILSPDSGYTGKWVKKETKTTANSDSGGNLVNAGQFEAVFTKNSQPYTPSHKESGYTQILQEGQVAPTATPTAEPTLNPTINPTVKPTTQPTQKSPAPFFGLAAGLGAAVLLMRMRR